MPGIVKVGVDGFLVRVRLHKFGIIGFRNIIFGNICAGVGKREHFFLGYANQFHILAVHTPQIVLTVGEPCLERVGHLQLFPRRFIPQQFLSKVLAGIIRKVVENPGLMFSVSNSIIIDLFLDPIHQ